MTEAHYGHLMQVAKVLNTVMLQHHLRLAQKRVKPELTRGEIIDLEIHLASEKHDLLSNNQGRPR